MFTLPSSQAVPKPLVDRAVLYPHLTSLAAAGIEAPEPVPASRIWYGEESEANAHPFQAALQIDGMYFCGGSLICEFRLHNQEEEKAPKS